MALISIIFVQGFHEKFPNLIRWGHGAFFALEVNWDTFSAGVIFIGVPFWERPILQIIFVWLDSAVSVSVFWVQPLLSSTSKSWVCRLTCTTPSVYNEAALVEISSLLRLRPFNIPAASYWWSLRHRGAFLLLWRENWSVCNSVNFCSSRSEVNFVWRAVSYNFHIFLHL